MENKTDVVTFSMLKEMMAIQDSTFRASTQLIIEDIRSEMKTIKKNLRSLKSQYDIEVINMMMFLKKVSTVK